LETRDDLSRLKRALAAIDRLQARIGALESAAREPVAIIGIGCRFPGGIASPESLWDVVAGGREVVGLVPLDAPLDAPLDGPLDGPRAQTFRRVSGRVDTSYGLIDGIDLFDASFFDISDEEAVRADPQQRILLEVAWEAIERAGYAPSRLAGSATGLFLGIGSYSSDYAWLQFGGTSDVDLRTIAGNVHSLIAGRISYAFDLRGPCLAVDGACASSLVAIDLALQSLRRGECDLALAAGVNAILTPFIADALKRGGMLSASGHCRSFDAGADGFVRAEGCGVLVMRRLRDALASRDNVLAIIRGSAVVHGGRSNGLTAPNGLAEEDVMRRALRDASVDTRDVSYLEAHATGTLLGDAVELQAIENVFGSARSERLRIGCVKTNLGHAEGAAGMAGVIKTVMAMRHGAIPPTLHFTSSNPHVDLDQAQLEIPTALTAWTGSKIAGVSAFGMNGTNAHVVLSAPEAGTLAVKRQPREELLVLSARTSTALMELARQFVDVMADDSLRDLCFTAACGREHFAHRLAIVAKDAASMRAQLAAFIAGDSSRAACMVSEGAEATFSRAQLAEAARAYLGGATIDWNALYSEMDLRRRELPTYPFERKSYWIDNDLVLDRAATAWHDWVYAPVWVERQRPVERSPDVVIYEASAEKESVLCERLIEIINAESASENPRRVVVVTRHPAHGSTLRGLVAVVALEHPELRCKHVEVVTATDREFRDECHVADDESDVRLVGGKRFVRRLHNVALRSEPFVVRSDGTYLIAGGTGAIGRRLAQWLFDRGAKRIVLASRTGAPVDGFDVVPCDLGDREQVRSLLAGIDDLRGVIHVAGIVSDRLLAHENEAHLRSVFRAKVDGARNLHEETLAAPLDFFLLFSSATSLLGLTGAGAYAAANAALDRLAEERHESGRPALSVNWAAWGGVGMAAVADADARRAEAWRAHGIDSFTSDNGLAFLEIALASQHHQLAFLPADWNRFLSHFRNDEVPPLLRDLVPFRQPHVIDQRIGESIAGKLVKEHSETARRDLMLRFINDCAVRVLGRPRGERLDVRRPLTELGIDSLGAIELRNLISIGVDRKLPATLAFNHPTIEALAHNLARPVLPRIEVLSDGAAQQQEISDHDAALLLDRALDEWTEAKSRG
jgi:3-oxoacyl-[acyl-carrier-protein] synthase II